MVAAAAGGAASVLGSGSASALPGARRRPPGGDKKRVAIFGAGPGGLSAALELVERGYSVDVYERHAMVGGKARSYSVPGTGTGGRMDLPAEMGFHAVWGTYQTFPRSLAKVPTVGGTANDMVIGTLPGKNAQPMIAKLLAETGQAGFDPVRLLGTLTGELSLVNGINQAHVPLLASKMLGLMTSGTARQWGHMEFSSLADYIGPQANEPGMREVLLGIFSQVTIPPERFNARLGGTGNLLLFSAYMGAKGLGPGARDAFAMADGPINEGIWDPFRQEIERQGGRFHMRHSVTDLACNDRRITGATVRGPDGVAMPIEADWYILSVSQKHAAPLLNSEILAAAPGLRGVQRMAQHEMWLGAAQIYLNRKVHDSPGAAGKPWLALFGDYSRLWTGAPFETRYGSGAELEYVTTDLVDWLQNGNLYGKPANYHSPDELLDEMLFQFRRYGNTEWDRQDIAQWHLNPSLSWDGHKLSNDEPIAVMYPGVWSDQPEPETEIENLFIGATYARSVAGIDSMEGACEAGRRSVNAIIDRSGDQAEKAWVDSPEPPAPFKQIWEEDDRRFHAGLPNAFDIVNPYRGQPSPMPAPWPGY